MCQVCCDGALMGFGGYCVNACGYLRVLCCPDWPGDRVTLLESKEPLSNHRPLSYTRPSTRGEAMCQVCCDGGFDGFRRLLSKCSPLVKGSLLSNRLGQWPPQCRRPGTLN